MQQLWGRALDDEMNHWAYVGDSTNDQLMFKTIANNIGVADIARFVPQLTALKRLTCCVTQRERGEGFAQVAAALLTAATRPRLSDLLG